MEPKHTKITTYELQDDGSLKATTLSYFDKLASRKEDIIQNVKTNRNDFLSDVMACLEPINRQLTRELHLIITVDEWNQPGFIAKQYTISKENFKKR